MSSSSRPVHGPLRPVLLEKGEHAIDQDHDEDGHAQLRHASNKGEAPGHPQQHGEEMDHLGPEPDPGRTPGGRGQGLGPVPLQPLGGRDPREPRARRSDATGSLRRHAERAARRHQARHPSRWACSRADCRAAGALSTRNRQYRRSGQPGQAYGFTWTRYPSSRRQQRRQPRQRRFPVPGASTGYRWSPPHLGQRRWAAGTSAFTATRPGTRRGRLAWRRSRWSFRP
jgi:hypothetical protein